MIFARTAGSGKTRFQHIFSPGKKKEKEGGPRKKEAESCKGKVAFLRRGKKKKEKKGDGKTATMKREMTRRAGGRKEGG